MKAALLLLALSLFTLPTHAKKKFELYAMLTENTPVELADGARWMMDKGDVFPVMMYKEQQTKIVLQLAGTSFLTETSRVRILSPKEIPEGLASYRRNVETYLKSQAESWRKEAVSSNP
jgi:hypothetical protein